jgi:hypothetical protein
MSEPGFETIVFWPVDPSPSEAEWLIADVVLSPQLRFLNEEMNADD